MPLEPDIPDFFEHSTYDRSYGHVVGYGCDYLQEAWKWTPSPDFIDAMNAAQAQAARAGREGVWTLGVGDRDMYITAGGAKGGYGWVLMDDCLIIMISQNRGYDVSVRYLAAGLWQYGVNAMREQVKALIESGNFIEHEEPDHPKVTRFDYCMDFQSSEFEQENMAQLAKQIVTSNKRKVRIGGKASDPAQFWEIWAGHGRIETLTVGKMPALQIQIYDKTQEITDISGKEWMKDRWSLYPEYVQGQRVYRLEVRMSKNWLKSRRVRTYEQLSQMRPRLWADALKNNRLVTILKNGKQTSDSRMRRLDDHPLWRLAFEAIGDDEPVPIGRRVTGRRDALRKNLIAQLAGTLRSTTVLAEGDYCFENMLVIAEEAMITADEDRSHKSKIEQAQMRYENVESARA